MSKWYDDKSKIKDLFDSLRNYGICGGILYGGIHLLSTARGGYVSIMQTISGAALIFLSIFLFYINTKAINRLFLEWTKNDLRGAIVAHFIWAVMGIFSVFVFTHSSLQIKLPNGKIIGEMTILDFISDRAASQDDPIPGSIPTRQD